MRTNRKNRSTEKGFTLIELVVVIAILAILAGVAVPRFVNITQSAKDAAETEDVKAIRAGIRMKALEDQIKTPGALAYPGSLETGNADAVFENVLEIASAKDMKTRGWVDGGDDKTYTSPNGNTWNYTKATGEFIK